MVFGSAGIKDNLRNIEETGEFTCSLATYDLREQMNITSAPMPYGEDEFPLAGLTAAPSRYVKPPRVKESPAALECRHFQTIALPGAGRYKQNYHLVIGLIVGIYIDDRFIKDGIVDSAGMMPIARLGYMDYSVVRPDTVFTIERPSAEDARAKKTKSD